MPHFIYWKYIPSAHKARLSSRLLALLYGVLYQRVAVGSSHPCSSWQQLTAHVLRGVPAAWGHSLGFQMNWKIQDASFSKSAYTSGRGNNNVDGAPLNRIINMEIKFCRLPRLGEKAFLSQWCQGVKYVSAFC